MRLQGNEGNIPSLKEMQQIGLQSALILGCLFGMHLMLT